MYLVLEYAELGEVQKYIRDVLKKPFSENDGMNCLLHGFYNLCSMACVIDPNRSMLLHRLLMVFGSAAHPGASAIGCAVSALAQHHAPRPHGHQPAAQPGSARGKAVTVRNPALLPA